MASSFFDLKAKDMAKNDVDMSKYKNRVVLAVNVASQCGFTRQYAGLQELNDKYASKGLSVLGFPCNQFGAQEPGSNDEIQSFCSRKFGVKFDLFDKVDVNGGSASPVFAFLKQGGADIRWNFEKFLVDKSGKVVKRYSSRDEPSAIAKDIEALL